jgi:hypothetical protein
VVVAVVVEDEEELVDDVDIAVAVE